MDEMKPDGRMVPGATYLRVVARRWWIVAAIAGIAAILASLVYLGVRPRTYVATVSVVVPVPPTSSVIPATAQAVADLDAVISSYPLAARVAAQLGLSAGAVQRGLDAARVGGGALLEVRFESSDPAVAERGAALAAREGLAILAEARLAPFEQRLRLAEQAYASATQAVRDYLERFGNIQPQAEFDQVSVRLLELRDRADEALARGDDGQANALDSRIQALTERWSPLIVEWQELSAARSRAQRQLEGAQLDEAAARSALEAAMTDGNGVVTSAAVPVSRTAVFVRSVVPIVVLATVLAILFVVGMELVFAGRSGPSEGADGTARAGRSAG